MRFSIANPTKAEIDGGLNIKRFYFPKLKKQKFKCSDLDMMMMIITVFWHPNLAFFPFH